MDIILIAGKKHRTLNFIVNWGVLIVIGGALVSILGIFVYSLINFAVMRVDQTKLKELTRENRVVREELARIEKEILSLGRLLDSLELADQKLQSYASLAPLDKAIEKMEIEQWAPQDSGELPEGMLQNLGQLSKILDTLLARAKRQRKSSEELITHLEEKEYLKDHTPSIAPVQGWFMRRFGYCVDPFTSTIKMHEGIDIAAPVGTPIIAPANGTVKAVRADPNYGLMIEIDHGYNIVTRYAHCQMARVEPGLAVKRGDIIGYVGDTGKSTGPHLHYEVWVSQTAVDPIPYILLASKVVD